MRPKCSVTSFRLIQALAQLLAQVLCCGVLATAEAQTNYQRLRSFGFPDLSGVKPNSPLMEGGDGKLYGTTEYGGSNDAGTVFKLNKDASSYEVLHSFGIEWPESVLPELTEGTDQTLYGTTTDGGINGFGTVFKLNHDGSGYTVIHSFTGTWEDGANPMVGVTEGSDGELYGTTRFGGTNGYGGVFKLNKDGSGYTVLFSFTGSDGNGSAG